MAQLVKSGTIMPALFAPPEEKVISSQLVVPPKYDISGELNKIKVRLVAAENKVGI